MIDRDTARSISALLGTLLAMMVEDQHDAMLRGFGAGDDLALADDLVRLGEDFTTLARGAAKPKGVQAEVGVRLVREWKGERHEVEMVEGGVLYRGDTLASLSEAARVITGVRWNGPRFFGLRGAA